MSEYDWDALLAKRVKRMVDAEIDHIKEASLAVAAQSFDPALNIVRNIELPRNEFRGEESRWVSTSKGEVFFVCPSENLCLQFSSPEMRFLKISFDDPTVDPGVRRISPDYPVVPRFVPFDAFMILAAYKQEKNFRLANPYPSAGPQWSSAYCGILPLIFYRSNSEERKKYLQPHLYKHVVTCVSVDITIPILFSQLPAMLVAWFDLLLGNHHAISVLKELKIVQEPAVNRIPERNKERAILLRNVKPH